MNDIFYYFGFLYIIYDMYFLYEIWNKKNEVVKDAEKYIHKLETEVANELEMVQLGMEIINHSVKRESKNIISLCVSFITGAWTIYSVFYSAYSSLFIFVLALCICDGLLPFLISLFSMFFNKEKGSIILSAARECKNMVHSLSLKFAWTISFLLRTTIISHILYQHFMAV